LGKNFAKLDDNEITSNRDAASGDAKAAAALRFAKVLVTGRGTAAAADIDAVKAAGYSDAQVVEIILHVALNTLTNYVNKALGTEIDFPVVSHHAS
jgi:alkylhydroperoxidase family enzyme